MAHGDDVEVARYLADRFPSPYTLDDADAWIEHCRALDEPIGGLAIVVDVVACGGIAVERRSDIERRTGQVGYWLGRELWGRGIAARALAALTDFALTELDFERLQALVLDEHTASIRVLEKAGYSLESRRGRALYKAGQVHDGVVYVRLRS